MSNLVCRQAVFRVALPPNSYNSQTTDLDPMMLENIDALAVDYEVTFPGGSTGNCRGAGNCFNFGGIDMPGKLYI